MMSGSYTIRPACGEDAEAVAVMWQEMASQHAAYDGECWGWADDARARWRSHFLDMLDKEDFVVLVAADAADRPVGFVAASVRDLPPVFMRKRGGMITDVTVVPDRRGRGIGRKLTEAAFEALKAKGAECVELRVGTQNETAVGMYEKLGLRTVMYHMYKRL